MKCYSHFSSPIKNISAVVQHFRGPKLSVLRSAQRFGSSARMLRVADEQVKAAAGVRAFLCAASRIRSHGFRGPKLPALRSVRLRRPARFGPSARIMREKHGNAWSTDVQIKMRAAVRASPRLPGSASRQLRPRGQPPHKPSARARARKRKRKRFLSRSPLSSFHHPPNPPPRLALP